MKTVSILTDLLERTIHIEGKIDRMERTLQSADKKREYLKSYSQYGEDIVIYRLFEQLHIEKPSYIDIGAHHPYYISNTALLYETGSRGINIEANPILFRAFEKERRQDVNICCGVGKEVGNMPFYMIDEYSGRNTFIKELAEKFVQSNPDFCIQKVMQVEVQTLDQIVRKYVRGGVFPDYLSIDIEGLEYDVPCSYNLKENGPKILTLEIMHNHLSVKPDLEKVLKHAEYFLYLKTGSNYTWVKNQYKKSILE